MLKKPFLIIFNLLLCGWILKAQDFFMSCDDGALRKVTIGTCNVQLLTRTTIFGDITFHPNGQLYGIETNGRLFTVDTLTGGTTSVIQVSSTSVFPPIFNAMTADRQGILYIAASSGELFTYNPTTHRITNLGIVRVSGSVASPSGDLTFYQGKLFMATTSALIEINLQQVNNSTQYMAYSTNARIFGIVSYADCGIVETFAFSGAGRGTIYKIDWLNRLLVPLCDTRRIAYGGASRYEFRASVAESDTTRLRFITCNQAVAGDLPPRVLRNQFGCDSIILESRVWVPSDTVVFTNWVCDRNLIRSDTTRLRNFGGCDSLVIQQARLDNDTTKFVQNICRGSRVPFYNRTLTQTGDYYQNFPKPTGCDSVIALRLTVFDSVEVVKDSFVCAANQVRRDTLHLATWVGCDSTSILRKVLAPRLQDWTQLQTKICLGDSIRFGNRWFADTGKYMVQFKNIYGCDSTLQLEIAAARRDSIWIPSQTCDPKQVSDQIVRFKNQDGCDSVIRTNKRWIANPNQVSNLPEVVHYRIGDSVALNAQFNFTPTRLEWQPAQAVNCATCPNIWTRAQRSTLLELMATDSQSCQIRRAVMLRVDPNRQVYIPNVFSPNGDSFNDAFTIHGDANLQQIISVEIFNRWGIRLYHGESLALGTAIWDGQFQQQPLPPDVYVYWIQLRFRDGETVVYKGDVTLVR